MKKSYITKAHRILEILSWILIAVSFGIAIYGMNVLPSEIATHFNAREPGGIAYITNRNGSMSWLHKPDRTFCRSKCWA